jgi:hypothetical protein
MQENVVPASLLPRLLADVRFLPTLRPPLIAGIHPSPLFPFRKLRPPTASLQYQNGPARVLLRHLKPARLLVGCAGYGSNGWDSGVERSEVEV